MTKLRSVNPVLIHVNPLENAMLVYINESRVLIYSLSQNQQKVVFQIIIQVLEKRRSAAGNIGAQNFMLWDLKKLFQQLYFWMQNFAW